ncbi:beta strand repeat-containing protein (plasmid) [Aminobacter sp. UC22_36]|uniref:beta strand repeat-containing protein n=1 Tax=Aminobacter sp. UC22_36 TaxID=3374549 RepID=UPI003756955A
MATSVDQGNLSASATGGDALPERAAPLSEAQLLAQATEPAAKADPVPVDAGSGQPIQAAQPNATPPAQANPAEYAADASNVVHLPANISIDNIKVDGKNLILEQADGTEIVVKDAASNVPTFMLGDVELPRVALIAALEAGGVDVAFGPDGSISVGPGSANSSGGNFEAPVGGIGNGFDLSALLPPTALQFPQYENRELYPGLRRNRGPEIEIDTGNPGGDADFVQESGLAGIGSNPNAPTEFAGGTFKLSDPDGLSDLQSVTINGKTIAIADLQGSVIDGAHGVLTITSYNPSTGVATYSYELTSPTTDIDGVAETDDFTLTVSDGTDTSAPARIVIEIVDDVPTAVNDGPYGVVEDGASSVSGNVLTNDISGADTPKAFGAWDAAQDSAAVTALNSYGTLVQNGDGTWSYVLDNSRAATQALTASSNLSYTLHYTMTDADGDTSPATLTITITGANDSASVVTAALEGPDATVYEAGLNPNGSNAGATSETTGGSFTISATDGIQNIVIGGQSFTLAQIQAFATTNGTVNTGEGILTLTSYTGTATSGTVSYSYTLSATIDNDTKAGATGAGFDDAVTLTVNGVGGTTASDDLVIRIVDDVPTAVNDGPYGVVEDGASSVSGNVLTNDISGADTPKAFGAWDAAQDSAAVTALNSYGTLVQNGDGTWSYVLDNSRAATQALTASSNLSYTLHYTMTDADGDTSPATLTITITGANDSASVVTAALEGPDATVYEAGLNPNGSNAGATSETTGGSFTISATDGIQNIVIGGQSFTLAQIQAFATTNGTVNTGEGILTLTSYTGTATSGTVSYSYTLSATIDNDTKAGATGAGFDDAVTLTVNGVGGTTASDDLVIRIVDDVPTAVNDGPYGVVEDGASSVSGNVLTNDISGADTPKAFGAWDAAQDSAAVTALNSYGTLVQNGDGTWSYVLDNSRAATQALTASSNLSYTLHYTMTDADGDTSPATLTITITGANDSASVVTAALEGPDATVYEAGLNPNGSNAGATSETTGGSFTISATDGIQNIVIGGQSFTLAQIQAFATTNGTVNTGEGILTLTSYTGTATSGTVSYSYTLSATIDNDTKAGATGAGFDDAVTLTVNGVGGTTASDDLVIRIVDDVPTAVNDGPYGVVEDGASSVSGNVLTNDISGADTPKAFGAWDAAQDSAAVTALNSYGTLVQNGDGTWSYVLDNSRAATQALTASSNLSYTLHYTMTDADGDTSPATLTITITGANDSASVVTAALEGPDATVYEAGLNPNGSNAGATSETTGGSFTISATDGIQNIVIGGQSFTLAQIQAFATTNGSVNTGEGILTLTSYTGTATSGTVSYSYTLSATIDNDTKAGATGAGFDDAVTLTVNGVGGTTASDDLVIRIVDDVPTAVNDGPYGVVEDGASSVSGNVLTNDISGADTPKAFGAWDAAQDSAAVTALNSYGTLVQNGDGTWSYVLDNSRAATQALTASSNLSYTLHYTMTDADGDTSPATLTITITGANDSASVVTAALEGPDATVYEAGLNPNGSNAGATSETTGGSFTISATDGIQNIVIGGQSFTLAQIQAFATTNGSVNTGEGILTLTSYTGTATSGTVSYSYTLSATIDNDTKAGATGAGFDDAVTLTVNGVGGTTASDDLVIRIVDDVPTAVNDGPYGVVEDGASSVSGNVLTNDISGADTPKAFGAWDAAQDSAAVTALNSYGTLVQNGDGTWSYVLDNSRAATQALTASSNLSYTLHYTMTDADGDTSPATLTITITGANDSASVVTAALEGPDATVYEAGLNPNGSNAGATSETTGGSFTISATDGIQNIVIGGQSFTLAQIQAFATTNGTVNTGEGILTLTSYTGTATSGTVSYSYTLSATIDNDTKAGATGAGFDDAVTLTVNGVGGTTASDDLVIRIVDDVPTAVNDGPYGVVEDGASSVSGNVLTNDISGADTPKAFGAWDAAQDSAAVTALNSYGTLVQNGDGTWSYVLDNSRAATQALTASSNLSYTLHYTMTDADGDTSPATLTITITGANDSASVVTAALEGPDATVYEAGLNPNGSNAGATSETTGGSFTISATDGIQNIVIGGQSFTLAQIQAFATTNGTVNTGEGILTLTSYTGTATSGTVSYSYTLSATIDNDTKAGATGAGFDDAVTLTVNGVGGTTASDDLVIRIVDDVPTAVNDGPYGVVEDGASSVSGNVLTNDISGADTPKAFGAWDAAQDSAAVTALNSYGTLVQNGDGTWSYVLDNSRAATQALTASSNLSYTLHYTMTDADGDTSPATLTITITGANDSASVVTAALEGPDATVYEAGLNPNGSNAGATSETTGGSFTISATDGIQNIVIGGQSFTLAQIQAFATTNGTVNTGEGILTLTSYTGTATSGTVSYSYTLSATIDNDTKAGATGAGFDDAVTLTVNGVGGTTASDDLVIRIVDDVPTAVNDGPYGVVEDGASSVSGNVLTNDISGADTPKAFGAWDAAQDSAAVTALNSYGTLVQNGDGTWSYVLDNSRAATQALTASSNLSYTLHYTMTDADGDTSPATLTITITGANDSASVVTAALEGPDATVYEAGLNPNGSNAGATSETTGGSFTISATDGIQNIVIGGQSFTLAQIQAFATTNGTVNTGEGILTLTSYTGTATSGTVSYSYTLSATIDNDTKAGATGAGFDDAVTLTVNGVGGTTASDDLVIRIVDDVPTATDDTDTFGNSAIGSSIGGNVVSGVGTNEGIANADKFGADGPAAGAVTFVEHSGGSGPDTNSSGIAGATIVGNFGTLVVNADGSYVYTRTSAAGGQDQFTYTIKDADGDTDTATLTIGLDDAGKLIVGSNENDDETAPPANTDFDHTVPSGSPGTEGDLIGTGGDDIIVGDPGAQSTVQPGDTANIVFVLDTSGSMDASISFDGGTTSRLQALQTATNSAIDQLAASGAENVRIHLVQFNVEGGPGITFDLITNGVVNAGQVAAAHSVVDGFDDTFNGPGTNYESALQQVQQWVAGNSVTHSINGAETFDSNGGASNGTAVLLTAYDTKIAVVSAWNGATQQNVSGTTGAMGVSGNGSDVDNGEFLRFDFGAQNDFDAGGSFDPSPTTGSSGLGTQFADFQGPPIEFAEFAFAGIGSGESMSYTVHYTDNTIQGPISVSANGNVTVGTNGKTIAYVEFTGVSGDGMTVELNSTTQDHDGPLPAADLNKVVFISDGEPNAGGTFTDEASAIESGFGPIEAVGINVTAANLNTLTTVEGAGGSATNITTAEDLEAVIGELSGAAVIADNAGGDDIAGGGGNDIIFGDVMNTDALAVAAGLGTLPDSGWQVFVQLEAGASVVPAYASWTRADTVQYIKDHPLLLSEEAPRTGGNDDISGGAGNDLIYAQEGNDDIRFAIATDGQDIIHGGSEPANGADVLHLNISSAGETIYLETVAAYEARTGNNYVLPTGGSPVGNLLTSNESEVILVSNADSVAGAGVGASHKVYVQMTEIEEVQVTGGAANDTFVIGGSFSGTSLLPSTVSFNGLGGDDMLDLSARASGHRVIADGGAHTTGDTVKLDFAYSEVTNVVVIANGFQIHHDGIVDQFTNFESFVFEDGAISYADLLTVPAAPTITSVTDDVGTVTGPVVNGGVSNDTSLLVKVALAPDARAGDSVQLYNGAAVLGLAIVLSQANVTDGYIEIATPALAHGTTYAFNAKVIDLFAGVGAASANHGVTIDTTTAALGTPDLAVASDSGTSNTDNRTNDNTPTMTGSGAEAGATVTLYDTNGTTVLGSTTADGSGNWSITSSALADGAHTLTAKQTDIAGNTSVASTGLVVTVDTAAAAPSAPDLVAASDSGTLSTDNLTNDTTPTVTGSGAEANATVTLYDTNGTTVLGSTTADGSGNWSITSSALADGAHTLTVKQTDIAGNISGASPGLVVTIDTAAPAGTPTLSTITDDVAAITGNVANGGVTNDTTLAIAGTGTNGNVVAIYDGLTLLGTTTVAGGNWSFTTTALAEGSHSFTASYVDTAGNLGTATAARTLTVDTVAPAAPGAPDLVAASDSGTSNTDNNTNDTTPTFTGSGVNGTTVTIYAGATAVGSALVSGGTYTVTTSALTDGVYNITARASDAAGNEGAASGGLSVTIDATPPGAPGTPDLVAASDSGTSNTDNNTNDTTPTFTGSGVNGTTVTIYAGATAVGSALVSGGTYTVTTSALIDGVYNITARASDAAGNEGAASGGLSVTIDATPPGAPGTPDLVAASDSGTSNTDNNTNDTTPTFTGSGVNGTTVTIYAGATAVGSALVSGGTYTITTSALANGTQNITARVSDAAGNEGISAALAVTIDTVGPTVSSWNATDISSSTRSAEVTFSEAVTGFTAADVSVSSGTVASVVDSGDHITYTINVTGAPSGNTDITYTIAAGSYTDLAGNTGASGNVTDPIILDLDGNGFSFASLSSGVQFDINADGNADRVRLEHLWRRYSRDGHRWRWRHRRRLGDLHAGLRRRQVRNRRCRPGLARQQWQRRHRRRRRGLQQAPDLAGRQRRRRQRQG